MQRKAWEEYGFKASFTRHRLSYFWVCFDVLRLTLIKCTDLHSHESVIARLAFMKVLDIERMEGIQKNPVLQEYCMWELRPPQLLLSEPSRNQPPILLCSAPILRLFQNGNLSKLTIMEKKKCYEISQNWF